MSDPTETHLEGFDADSVEVKETALGRLQTTGWVVTRVDDDEVDW